MATYSDEEYMWDIISTSPNISHKEYRKRHGNTWLTKDRRVLRIKDMDTGHIVNCIGMLERAGQEKTKAYRGLIKELKSRTRKKHENEI